MNGFKKRKKSNQTATERYIIMSAWMFKPYWIINWRFLEWKKIFWMRKKKTGCKTDTGCVRWVWCVSRSSLESTASKPAHPGRSNPPRAAVPICLPSPHSSLFDKATARGHQSSVCAVRVYVKQKEKGQKKKREAARLQIHRWAIFFSPGPFGQRSGIAARLANWLLELTWHVSPTDCGPLLSSLDQIKPVGWCSMIGALVLSNSPETKPDAYCCLYHRLIHWNNSSYASYPGMCIWPDESYFQKLAMQLYR